jgi:hypothetical protein
MLSEEDGDIVLSCDCGAQAECRRLTRIVDDYKELQQTEGHICGSSAKLYLRNKSLEALIERMRPVVEVLIRYRDDGGIQHHWSCDSNIHPIGKLPCDCGADNLYDALSKLSAAESKEAA